MVASLAEWWLLMHYSKTVARRTGFEEERLARLTSSTPSSITVECKGLVTSVLSSSLPRSRSLSYCGDPHTPKAGGVRIPGAWEGYVADRTRICDCVCGFTATKMAPTTTAATKAAKLTT